MFHAPEGDVLMGAICHSAWPGAWATPGAGVGHRHGRGAGSAGSSRNAGNGSYLVEVDAAECLAGGVPPGANENGRSEPEKSGREGVRCLTEFSATAERCGAYPRATGAPCHLCPSIARALSRVRASSRVKPPLRVRRSELRKAPLPSASPRSLARALIYVPLLHPMRIMAVGRE